MLIEIALTTAGALAGLLVLIYYMRKGQFEDMEDVKYQMFRNEQGDGAQQENFTTKDTKNTENTNK